ncbi:6333_t:CDS:2, partial [Acaulospora colombiana]
RKKQPSTSPRPASAPVTVAPPKPTQNSNVPINVPKQPTSLATSNQPSLLGQGQGITSLFSGSGSSPSVPESQEPKYQDSQNNVPCGTDAKALKSCLENNNYDVNA